MKEQPPPVPDDWFVRKNLCPECNKPRSKANHTECSKTIQARFKAENDGNKQ